MPADRLLQVIGLGRIARLAEDAAFFDGGLKGFKGMGLGAVFQEVGIGEGQVAVGLGKVVVDDRDQARATGNGHGLEQHGVDQGEHHGVEPDAECERGDDGSRKPAVGQDHAQRESQVRSHDALTNISRALFRNRMRNRPMRSMILESNPLGG